MALSIMARSTSAGELVFLIFLAVLFFTLNIPVGNFLNKLIKGHKNLCAIIEIALFVIIARALAKSVEPFVNGAVDCLVDMIVDQLSKL